MLCKEQIRKVLVIAYQKSWGDLSYPYIQFTPELICYISKREWMILQTDNHYLLIGPDGVQTYQNLDSFSEEDYWIGEYSFEDDDYIIEYAETTLLKDEFLCEIIYNEDEYRLVFDDYSFNVCVCDELEPQEPLKNSPLCGFDRHIIRKCECGGKAEIFYDFVGDFFLQCNKCGKWTWHTYELKTVIDDWNDGEVNEKTDVT